MNRTSGFACFLATCIIAFAGQANAEVHVTLAPEFDSNARRVPDNDLIKGDALLRALFGGGAQGRFGDVFIRAQGDLGAKLFVNERSENMGVGQGRVLLSAPFAKEVFRGARITFDLFAKTRAQVSQVRTYALTQSRLAIDLPLSSRWRLGGGFSGGTFQAIDAPLFANFSSGLFLTLTSMLSAKERVEAQAHAGVRAFPYLLPVPDVPDGFTSGSRTDLPLRLLLQFRSSRQLLILARYEISRTSSNSKGAAFTRHRFLGQVGFRLPAALTLNMRANAQLTQYDDGVSAGQEVFLRVDDESQNAFSLSLSKPIFEGWLLEARGAMFANEIAADGLSFLRTTVSVGVRGEWK